MSSFSFAAQLARVEADGDQAGNICGDPPRANERLATRVGMADETPVYVEDIPVTVSMTPYVEEYVSGRFARWVRIECKVERHATTIASGDWYILARFPYSTATVEVARFKPPYKKSLRERPTPGPEVVTSEDFIAWTDELSFDYFETRDVLTASISLPDMRSLRDPQGRHEYGRGIYLHGVCSDVDSMVKNLMFCEESRRLIQMTEENIINFHHPRAKLGRRPKLKEKTIESAEQLLELAVYQALAGPVQDSKSWMGRPVADAIQEIYPPLLNTRNRRKSQ